MQTTHFTPHEACDVTYPPTKPPPGQPLREPPPPPAPATRMVSLPHGPLRNKALEKTRTKDSPQCPTEQCPKSVINKKKISFPPKIKFPTKNKISTKKKVFNKKQNTCQRLINDLFLQMNHHDHHSSPPPTKPIPETTATAGRPCRVVRSTTAPARHTTTTDALRVSGLLQRHLIGVLKKGKYFNESIWTLHGTNVLGKKINNIET